MYLNLASSSSYLWIGKNILCTDKGYTDIDEKNDCKAAAEEKGLVFKTVTESSYPKGCYLNEEVWFNHHSVGSRQSNSAPICKGIFYRSGITTLKYDDIIGLGKIYIHLFINFY